MSAHAAAVHKKGSECTLFEATSMYYALPGWKSSGMSMYECDLQTVMIPKQKIPETIVEGLAPRLHRSSNADWETQEPPIVSAGSGFHSCRCRPLGGFQEPQMGVSRLHFEVC